MHLRKYLLLISALACIVAIYGCSHSPRRNVSNVSTNKKDTPIAAAPKPIDLNKIKPNELGKVLILEYHDVGDKEERWVRQRNNFRTDLKRLYDLGYYPISLRDFVNNNINVPAGKSPVVITFDDGTAGQFSYIYAGNELKVDPNCAIGIMEDFHRIHPDWPLEATFYVYYPVPFRQKDQIKQKLQRIIDDGMDIGNHTYTHTRLDLDSDADAMKEMALNVKSATDYTPKAIVDSIALPYGKHPKNESVLKSGEYDGKKYHNIAALLVGAEPALSPVAVGFDPCRLPRVQAIQSELDMWLGNLSRPNRRYISDGDPDIVTVPKSFVSQVDKAKLGKKRLRTY